MLYNDYVMERNLRKEYIKLLVGAIKEGEALGIEHTDKVLSLFSNGADYMIGENENTAISYHEALHPNDTIHEAANASRANMLRDEMRARKKEMFK